MPALRHGGERIDIWYRHEQNICLRHRLWTGHGTDHPRDQPDLAVHPDIVHAQARHLRLIRRHGRQAVHTAYNTARLAWETITDRGRGMPHVIMRDIPLPKGFGHQDWPARPQARPGPHGGQLPRSRDPDWPSGLTMAAGRLIRW
jgi:hypothetical protein